MEHDGKPLPIDTRLLGALAEKVFNFVFTKYFTSGGSVFYFMIYKNALLLQCRAFAKALHYKEMEFEAACSKKMGANPVTVVESLIHINNQLHQHEVHCIHTVCGSFILCNIVFIFFMSSTTFSLRLRLVY